MKKFFKILYKKLHVIFFTWAFLYGLFSIGETENSVVQLITFSGLLSLIIVISVVLLLNLNKKL
jgi:hypothetical protein